jgi:hypothetical protein
MATEAEKVHDQLQKFEPKYAATLKRDLAQTPPRALQRSTDVPSTREDNQAHGT